MEDDNVIRIDKFLWAARIYKTRSIATDECRKGRITINNQPVKPSRPVAINEIIVVRKPPVVFTYRVLKLHGNRVGAKRVGELIEDLTPEDEKNKLLLGKPATTIFRPKGAGRPTKKDRRLIDRLKEDIDE